MEATSNHLGDSSHRLGRGIFDTTRFVLELSWQPSCRGVGAQIPIQIHYNESSGYPGAELKEESTCSLPVPLGLLAPRVSEAIRPGC